MNQNEVLKEAGRCLYCYDAPCIKGCPAGIDIPSFIRAIKTEDFKSAAKFIFEANCLGSSCARVCPTEELCEGNCTLNQNSEPPVKIAKLQQFVSDMMIKNKWNFLERKKPIGVKAAIVGAGPAGISCAVELFRNGWDVEIFEADEKPGGLNTYGISHFKITSKTALDEINFLKSLGIKIKLGVSVGKDVTLKKLLDKYNAVFLGIGLNKARSLSIKGEGLKGVVDALQLLRETKIKNHKNIKIGNEIVVIGAGNTAIDSAIAAKKLGAENVRVVYRRSEAEMPAFKNSFEKAKLAGVLFFWQTAPIEILGVKGKVKGVKCLRMKLGKPDSSGRRRPIPIEGSEHIISCDMVIKGLGQEPYIPFLSELPNLKLTKEGLIEVSSKTGMTSIKGLFAGGDCVNGGKEVVNAVKDGKIAALGMQKFISNKIAKKH